MKLRYFVFVVFLASLICAGGPFAISQESPMPTNNKNSAEDEVSRLNAVEVEAFLHQDLKTMAHVWSDDLVVTNPLNKLVTKQQVLGMMESGVLVITSFDRRIEYIRRYGNTIIVAGTEAVVWGGKMPMAGKAQNLRFTGVWMKQGGRWQEVARHANIVP